MTEPRTDICTCETAPWCAVHHPEDAVTIAPLKPRTDQPQKPHTGEGFGLGLFDEVKPQEPQKPRTVDEWHAWLTDEPCSDHPPVEIPRTRIRCCPHTTTRHALTEVDKAAGERGQVEGHRAGWDNASVVADDNAATRTRQAIAADVRALGCAYLQDCSDEDFRTPCTHDIQCPRAVADNTIEKSDKN